MWASLDARAAELRGECLEAPFEALKALHVAKRPARPGDWLHAHREVGQTAAAYQRSRPVRPGRRWKAFDLQPLGDFSAGQGRLVTLTADYVGRFFGLPVRVLDPLPLASVPAWARRVHPAWNVEQVLTGYLLDEVLIPRRPRDSVGMVALTNVDLYPDASWDFVFGQASMGERVGVWSLFRAGELDNGPQAFRVGLRRTISTAAHEVGHMLSMPHCIAYECALNGSNHREEADARPLDLCPVCLQKLAWNVGCDPEERLERLVAFVREHGLHDDAEALERTRRRLREAAGEP
jgi:archaemetzincin